MNGIISQKPTADSSRYGEKTYDDRGQPLKIHPLNTEKLPKLI
jgi:hypothetical protein